MCRCSLRKTLGTSLVGYLHWKQVLHPNHKTVGRFQPGAYVFLSSVAFSVWELSRVLSLAPRIPPTSLKVRTDFLLFLFGSCCVLITHRLPHDAPSFIIDTARLFANHPTTRDDSYSAELPPIHHFTPLILLSTSFHFSWPTLHIRCSPFATVPLSAAWSWFCSICEVYDQSFPRIITL